MLPPSGLCCCLVPTSELTQCLQWALPRYRLDRAFWILSQVTQRVQAGQAHQIVAGTAWCRGETGTLGERIAAVIATEQSAGAATLLLLQTVSAAELQQIVTSTGPNAPVAAHADERQLIRALFEPVLERLRSLGITFLQATCDEPAQATLLQAADFEQLAELSLMALPASAFAQAAQRTAAEAGNLAFSPAELQWVTLDSLGDDWEAIFALVAADTFTDTADCPRLSDFRSAEEIVAGYRTSPAFDRRLSKLLRVGQQWAGCLVLTRNAESTATLDGVADPDVQVALELTYMGLRPEFRGKRLAGYLLAETVRVATQIGAAQIMLAVDQQNRPARANYHRYGWRDVAQESVWGRRV